LFQPGQVVHRDAGQPGELLAAQPGSAPPPAGRHTRRLRGGAVPPAADDPAELPRLHTSSLRDPARVVVALAVLRQRDRFLPALRATQPGSMTTTLITGANKGLGKETARQLVAAGHTVYVGARDEARGRAAADEIGARFVQLDVTDDASVAAAFAQIEADGGLDVLVNNAGIGMLALNGPDALRIFDTNAVGIIRVTEAALPLLRKSENPVVVNVSSALGSFWANHEPSRPASKVPAIVYGASKAAVSMLTVQYARAVPEVKFNSVEPGYTATELGGVPNSGGRPVEVSARNIVRMATIGKDGPTGTFQEDDGELGW
jgi:NAD(P)-dependent dehydrogenase (short-subunit alcohol dehydrogenase family)